MMTTKSRPVGSRVHRPRRKLAEARRYAFARLPEGRAEAIDALIEHARARAIHALRVSMPSGLRSARTLGDRLKGWALDKAAKLVAAKITRDTERRMFRDLEADRLPLQRWLSIMNDYAGTPA